MDLRRLAAQIRSWGAELGFQQVGVAGIAHDDAEARLDDWVARGLHGGTSTSFGLDIPTLKREAVYLQPGLVWDLGSERSLELSLPFTVKGRNWPAGLAVGIGFNSRF